MNLCKNGIKANKKAVTINVPAFQMQQSVSIHCIFTNLIGCDRDFQGIAAFMSTSPSYRYCTSASQRYKK